GAAAQVTARELESFFLEWHSDIQAATALCKEGGNAVGKAVQRRKQAFVTQFNAALFCEGLVNGGRAAVFDGIANDGITGNLRGGHRSGSGFQMLVGEMPRACDGQDVCALGNFRWKGRERGRKLHDAQRSLIKNRVGGGPVNFHTYEGAIAADVDGQL